MNAIARSVAHSSGIGRSCGHASGFDAAQDATQDRIRRGGRRAVCADIEREHSLPRIGDSVHYAYLDESGDVAPFSGSRFLVVAVLVTETPRTVELHAKRAGQSLGRKTPSEELKATWPEPRVIEPLLYSIAQEDAQVVAVVVDKRAIVRPPVNSEDIYRTAVAQTVRHCLAQWPRIHLYLDKRYTNPKLRRALKSAVSTALAPMPTRGC